MPSATIVVTSADPPLETSGSGIPIIGSSPITAPMFTSAWPSTQASTPPVAILTNSVVGAHDHPEEPEAEQAANSSEHAERAGQPELLADDREDEVVVRLRQPGPLLPAGAEPDPPPAAGGQRPQPVRGLPAGALVVAVAADPGVDPVHPVARGLHQDEHQHPGQRAPRCRTSGRSGAPATNSSAPTSAISTSAVPRSWPGQDQPEQHDRAPGDHRDQQRAPGAAAAGACGPAPPRPRRPARAWPPRTAAAGSRRGRSSSGCR